MTDIDIMLSSSGGNVPVSASATRCLDHRQ
jgi:hypothetical protein